MLKPYDFFFELPLYTNIDITEENKNDFIDFVARPNSVDGYNVLLKENTTYAIHVNKYGSNSKYQFSTYEGYTIITLTCVRTQLKLKFYILVYNNNNEEDGNEDENQKFQYTLLKVGQFPSIADLHISKLKQYDKVIDKNQLREITKAIGLAANGVGIGSFVYLRRVFEFLLQEAHSIAKNDTDWDENLYVQSKVVQRIELLKNHLPQFLVTNKTIYSILSVGIHKLDEQECLKYFEALKVGIELILDEKVEIYKRQKKIEDAKKKIQLINQQIKK